MGGLHQIPLLRTRGTPQERRGKECQSQREQRTPDQVPLNQLSKVHMNAQKLKQPAQSLHRSARVGPLHIQHSFQLSMYTGPQSVWTRGLCALGLLVRLFPFCWVDLSSLDVMDFVFSYILCCRVWLSSRRSLFFSNEKQKGSGPSGDRRDGGAGRRRGWGNCVRITVWEREKLHPANTQWSVTVPLADTSSPATFPTVPLTWSSFLTSVTMGSSHIYWQLWWLSSKLYWLTMTPMRN